MSDAPFFLFGQREKINQREDDESIAPTSFLWGAYYPNRYYFEVGLLSYGLTRIVTCKKASPHLELLKQ